MTDLTLLAELEAWLRSDDMDDAGVSPLACAAIVARAQAEIEDLRRQLATLRSGSGNRVVCGTCGADLRGAPFCATCRDDVA